MRILRASALVLCVVLPLAAVETQVWEHAYFADFAQGSLNKLSLSSNGRLTPGPVVRELYDASTAILWAIAMDSKGNVFAGGGGVDVKVWKFIAARAEVRSYDSPTPVFNGPFTTDNKRQLVASGGVVLRF